MTRPCARLVPRRPPAPRQSGPDRGAATRRAGAGLLCLRRAERRRPPAGRRVVAGGCIIPLSALAASARAAGVRLLILRGPRRMASQRAASPRAAPAAVLWNRRYDGRRDGGRRGDEGRSGGRRHRPPRASTAPCSTSRWMVRTGAGEPFKVFTPFWRAAQRSGAASAPLARRRQAAGAAAVRRAISAPCAGRPRPASHPAGLGRRAARDLDARARPAPQARLGRFPRRSGSTAMRDGRDVPGPRRAPRGSRPTCASARSARARSGTRAEAPARRRRRARRRREASAPSSAGASSATTCCSTIPIWRGTNFQRGFDAFPGAATGNALAPGSAGRPATRSSTPACASSGRRAGCTTACGWSSASFLIKHLLIDWRVGEALVLGHAGRRRPGQQPRELAVGGRARGADAAPYFRIFNPIMQGRSSIREGTMCARFVARARPPPAMLDPPTLDGVPARPRRGRRAPRRRPIRSPVVDHAEARGPGAAALWRFPRRKTETERAKRPYTPAQSATLRLGSHAHRHHRDQASPATPPPTRIATARHAPASPSMSAKHRLGRPFRDRGRRL